MRNKHDEYNTLWQNLETTTKSISFGTSDKHAVLPLFFLFALAQLPVAQPLHVPV